MSEAGYAIGGAVSGLAKILCTLAGVGLAIVGAVTQNWTLVWIGGGLLVLGQVIHAIDQVVLDRQLQGWAAEAVAGVGPIPPKAVRKQLINRASATEGLRGDVQGAFKHYCWVWAGQNATTS